MKKHILLLTMTTLMFSASAQNWALPSSRWTVGYSWMSPPSYFALKVDADTVVDGVNCKKIGMFVPLYTYESNDTVYLYLWGKFRPTYYFSAQVGDTISFYDNNHCAEDTSLVYAVVDSVDSIDVGNKFLKRFKCNITNRDSTSFWGDLTYTYIESVGSNYLYPYYYCANIIDQESYGICDYGDSTIQNFYVFHNNCQSVSIDEVNFTDKEISVFPNPSQLANTILLNQKDAGNVNIRLFDTEGRFVKQVVDENLSKGSYKFDVDIQSIATGIYYYEITLGSKNTYHLKFIKI